jgi:integrase
MGTRIVTTEMLIYTDILINKIEEIKDLNIHVKATCLRDLTIILEPTFIRITDPQELYNMFNYLIRMRGRASRENNFSYFEDRIAREKAKIGVEIYHEIRINIEEFIDSKSETEIKGRIEEYLKGINDVTDILKNRYLVFNSEEVFSIDTTERQNVYITLLIDISTREIASYLRTDKEPTASELVSWLRGHFVIRQKGNPVKIILHADSAGQHFSKEMRAFCDKFNIKLSLVNCKVAHGNQVSERINGIFWDWLPNYTLRGLDNVDFFDMSPEQQNELIEYVILVINNRKDSSSEVLRGKSPLEMKEIKKWVKSNQFAIARSKTKFGDLIIKAIDYNSMLKDNLDMQEMINNFLGSEIFQIEEKDVRYITLEDNVESQEALQLVTNDVKNNNSILERVTSITKNVACTPDDLLNMLSNEIENNASDLSQGEQLLLGLSVGQILKMKEQIEIFKQDNLKKDKMLLEAKSERAQMINILEKLNNENDLRVKERAAKDAARQRRIVNKNKQRKSLYAIFPEDFEKIFYYLKGLNNRLEYPISRDIFAHFFLFAYGVRLGNLRFVTQEVLEDLLSYKTIYIRYIKSKNVYKRSLPYIKSLKNFIDILKEDHYPVILKHLEKNSEKLIEKMKINNGGVYNPEESLIWSPYVLNREAYNKRINSQLSKTSVLINKGKFTSHSYRRGFAQLVARKINVQTAQKMLNHTSITTTMAYLPESMTVEELTTNYNSVHKIKNSKDIANYPNKTKNELKRIDSEMEIILDEDEAESDEPEDNSE